MESKRPVFDKEPDKINDIGTKFWDVTDFDYILTRLPIENLSVMWSEYIDEEGEEYYGYILIEGDDVVFETPHKRDVREVLETIFQESIDRGLIDEIEWVLECEDE